MALVMGAPTNDVAVVAQFVALAGASYALARIVVRKLIVEPRVRRRDAQIARGEPADADYEDALVYPDNQRRRN
jgi:hypothetical protein